MEKIKGKINSFQTLGTLDGPGVRFTVFLQGCNLRCGCCHNPETWKIGTGTEYTVGEIVSKAERYREYFGSKGGITLSGGEPLLQAEFVKEVFSLCKEKGIHTCIDTSGSIINDEVLSVLDYTDYILLDIKYTTDEMYQKYAGCEMDTPLEFLRLAENKNIPVTLRQVIIPTLNDNEDNILTLKKIASSHKCVQKTELLPFKKLCVTKYEKENIPFRFADIPEPSRESIEKLTEKLNK